MKNNNIIQFICYNPRIYSGFDNFQIRLTRKLHEKSFQNILVYSDALNIPKLKRDILDNNGIIEIISTKNSVTTLRDILRIIIKYKPRIIHTHFDNRIHLIVALLSVVFRIDYYFSFWSEITAFTTGEYIKKRGILKFFLLRFFYNLLVFVSRKALMGSNTLKKQFSEFYSGKSTKVQTFYLGTEIYKNYKSKDALRQNYKVPEGYLVFSNISAVEHIKGIHVLIDALILLKEKYNINDFICFHIGSIRSVIPEFTGFYNTLIEKVKINRLGSNFRWLEFIDDVTDILKISDIYVHPSLQEGLGSANLEAATQSLPIIGTNIGGIPEIIHHGINGFLFHSGSAEELAGYLNLLINDKELRIIMGSESYRIVNETFNFEKQIQILVELYLSGINERFIIKEL
jgi:glycosyltransferase involved in cell wall biosynthesis